MAGDSQYPPLGGRLYAKLMDEIKLYTNDLVEQLKGDLTVDGPPPGMVEASPRQEYEQLMTMQMTGDPMFNAEADARLKELSLLFGAPPASPFVGPAMGMQ